MTWTLIAAELAAEAPRMGRIVGGWEYVWACYILTWTGIVLYSGSLFLRLRKP